MASKGKEIAGKGSVGKRKRDDSDKSGGRKRKNLSVLQFFEDSADVDDYSDSEDSEIGDDFFEEEFDMDVKEKNETGKAQNLPFLPKEEELTVDEFERALEERYKSGSGLVTYADDENDSKRSIDRNFLMPSAKDPTIWKVKCMVGRERHSAFCLMQKYIDLQSLGTKLQIISAFAVEHVKGFIYIEADKQSDVNEACKGLCSIYSSRLAPVPKNEISHLLSVRSKYNEVSEGMWARVKNGKYKGDLAQVVAVNDARKRATIKLIPRINLRAIAEKFGWGVSLKKIATPAPRLISSSELEEFRPLIHYRRDRDTGKHFEILDGLMLKDGYLYKKVSIDSLTCWGVVPLEEELQKFTPSKNDESENVEWLTQIYGEQRKKRCRFMNLKSEKGGGSKGGGKGGKGEGTSGSSMENNFEVDDLVCFGRKDFGVILGVDKDNKYKILKEGSEGPVTVTVDLRELKNVPFDKKFTALDQHMKIISINDTVKVLEGPSKGRQGIVKQIYRGTIFLYDESEMENSGYFCSRSQMCQKVKRSGGACNEKGGESSGLPAFDDFPSSPKSPLSPKNPWQARENNRDFNRGDKDGIFSVGQTLRIKVGPLKGYICRVLAVRRSDVTVKLDSRHKVLTVKCEDLSEVREKKSAISLSEDPESSTMKAFDFLGTHGCSADWMEGAGKPAESDGWNAGGLSAERSSWPSFPTASFSLQPDSSSANPLGSVDNDSNKGDDAWERKITQNQDSPWGAAIADVKASVESDQAGGWVQSGDSWNQASSKDVTGNHENSRKKSESSWDRGKSVSVNPTGSWNSEAAGKNQLDSWGKGKNIVEAGSVDEREDGGGDGFTWGKAVESKYKGIGKELQEDSWGKAAEKWGCKDASNGSKADWGNPMAPSENTSGSCASAGEGWSARGSENIVQSSGWNRDKSVNGSQKENWGGSKSVGEDAARWGNQNNDSWNKQDGGSSWKKQDGGSCNKAEVNAEDEFKGRGNQNNDWGGSKSFGGDRGFSGWNKGQTGDKNDTDQQNTWERPKQLDGGRGSGGGRRGRGGARGGRDQFGRGRSFGQDQSSGWNKGGQENNWSGDGAGLGKPSTWNSNQVGGWSQGKGFDGDQKDDDWNKPSASSEGGGSSWSKVGDKWTNTKPSGGCESSWNNNQTEHQDGVKTNAGNQSSGWHGGGSKWNSSKSSDGGSASGWNKGSAANEESGGSGSQQNSWNAGKATVGNQGAGWGSGTSAARDGPPGMVENGNKWTSAKSSGGHKSSWNNNQTEQQDADKANAGNQSSGWHSGGGKWNSSKSSDGGSASGWNKGSAANEESGGSGSQQNSWNAGKATVGNLGAGSGSGTSAARDGPSGMVENGNKWTSAKSSGGHKSSWNNNQTELQDADKANAGNQSSGWHSGGGKWNSSKSSDGGSASGWNKGSAKNEESGGSESQQNSWNAGKATVGNQGAGWGSGMSAARDGPSGMVENGNKWTSAKSSWGHKSSWNNNQTEQQDADKANAGNQSSGWHSGGGKWNSSKSSDGGSGSGWNEEPAGSGSRCSGWNTGKSDAGDQGTGWGSGSGQGNGWNGGNTSGGGSEKGWGQSNNWKSTSSEAADWSQKSSWNSGNAFGSDQSGAGGNDYGLDSSNNRGRGNNWRGGRGNSDRGGFRGRGGSDGGGFGRRGGFGGRGSSDRGGFGGRGSSDRGGFGGRGSSERGGFGGRGSSDRGGFGGRGRGRRDPGGGWNNRNETGEGKSFGWNKGPNSNTEDWKGNDVAVSWNQGGGDKGNWQSWGSGTGSAKENGLNESQPGGWGSQKSGWSQPASWDKDAGGSNAEGGGWNKGSAVNNEAGGGKDTENKWKPSNTCGGGSSWSHSAAGEEAAQNTGWTPGTSASKGSSGGNNKAGGWNSGSGWKQSKAAVESDGTDAQSWGWNKGTSSSANDGEGSNAKSGGWKTEAAHQTTGGGGWNEDAGASNAQTGGWNKGAPSSKGSGGW
ncbi:protein RNA-directed DNA methylation 3 isoform X2 [Malania oleifera]|uniref:protein RNA-directed DNA methylation 3 isoform X2 n=1 Tax=Malania oleifera TaxID=397392 RepID=UPI0025AEC6E5|nr:protein RNA-directed DNA methylation 3 isoform X2 [Malania oleifera]